MSTRDPNPLTDRMGYLLKHARQALMQLTGPALEPYGIDGRALAVLTVLADAGRSQQEAAAHLGVDRTTMVALVDGLEAKGLVARTPDTLDRRKNVVTLTDTGRDVFERASEASRDAERRFLAPLTEIEAELFTAYLQAVVKR
jgi:DNA-binding MarR family transcriptional regulator